MIDSPAPGWDHLWATSHEVSLPRFEWPPFVVEICRAYAGTTDEEIRSWPPPTEEITFAKLCTMAFGGETTVPSASLTC